MRLTIEKPKLAKALAHVANVRGKSTEALEMLDAATALALMGFAAPDGYSPSLVNAEG